ncbi:hypothetical protein H311_03057 [Anncaliia algerae PRA109]|nr:hypothetical protein H311_03057 [Anncaliia algerae PRA109]
MILILERHGCLGLDNLENHHYTDNHDLNYICLLTGANIQLIENTWRWMNKEKDIWILIKM